MIEIPAAVHDDKRLNSLRKLNILDTPLEERYERLTRMTCRALGVPMAAFTLVDDNRQWFKSIQGVDATETELELSFCAHLVNGKEMLVENAQTDTRFCDHPAVTGGLRVGFYAGCPVRSPDGATVGSLCAIDKNPRPITEEQMEALRDIALLVENELKIAAMSKTQHDLVQELDTANRLALLDPMTRVWNRNGMDEILKREWAECLRRKTPMTMIMADIDHFKKVNDTYGHPVGDEVIKTVSKRLLAALRTEDALGRMGGEEFLMVMPNCNPGQVMATAERIRKSVIESPVQTEAGSLDITLSYGVTVAIPDRSTNPDEIIKRSDDALYAAKNNGRNRVEIML